MFIGVAPTELQTVDRMVLLTFRPFGATVLAENDLFIFILLTLLWKWAMASRELPFGKLGGFAGTLY